MEAPVRRNRRRGIALILALLTTVILVTLSLAFTSLSLTEARTSRNSGYEETSLQAATFGLEYALVYMGHGKVYQGSDTLPSFRCWETRPWPNPSNDANYAFGFYNNLTATTAPVRLTQQPSPGGDILTVSVSNITQDPTLEAFVPGNLSNNDKLRLRADLRRIRFLVPNGSQEAVRLIGGDVGFTCDVVVEPILISRNQGRHDFRLVATTQIFQINPGAGQLTTAQRPVATRVVEARVKESSFDYAHFIANGRSWNVNGHTVSTLPSVQDPNSTDPNKVIDLTDYVTIPSTYKEQGPMRVDGQDPTLKNGLTGANPLFRVVSNSGNLRFAPGANDGNVRFTHKISINQPANLYEDNVVDSTMKGFTAGISLNSARVGIPDFRRDDMVLASKLKVADTDVSGFVEVPTSAIPGARGSSQPAPRHVDPQLGPFYDGYQTVTQNGQSYQVPKPFDYRPRVPNTEITLSNDRVKMVRRDTYTGDQIGATQEFSVSQLQMGVIYVEGGNVVVKTEGNADAAFGKFRGKLSIVAGERAAREGAGTGEEAIYAQAAREFYNLEKRRWDLAYAAGQHPDPALFATPPYTKAQLQAAAAQFPANVTTPVPQGMANNQPLWPAPDAEVDAQGNFVKYKVEREGNVVIADDVVYDKTAGNSLGLFAQNFILLNDTTPSDSLTVDAVMMSKERSLSLDWDNTGRQNPTTWEAMMKTVDAHGDPIKRAIKIRGSVIGEYIDVEGDILGRGYTNQQFEYDVALRNANPPFMPRLNLAQLDGGFRYMILHYLDRGTLNAAGAL